MNKLLIISGPTATGKTDLAVKLAQNSMASWFLPTPVKFTKA